MRNPEFLVSVVLTLAIAFIIAVWVPGDAAIKVKSAISYGGLVMIFLFGFMILAAIASGKIDISQILSEKESAGASMSRFQLMIFTFVTRVELLPDCGKHWEIPRQNSDRGTDTARYQRHHLRRKQRDWCRGEAGRP